MLVYAATYGSVSAAETDLSAIEALHKAKVIGWFDAGSASWRQALAAC